MRKFLIIIIVLNFLERMYVYIYYIITFLVLNSLIFSLDIP